MAGAGTCLKWTHEEDSVLLQYRNEWEKATPRLPHSAYRAKLAQLLPHRSKTSIQCRLWLLKQPKPPNRWSGYSNKVSSSLHPTELAWLAGIFDGEGSIMAGPTMWNAGLYLCYGNNRAIIDRVHALVPGSKLKVSKKAGSNNGIRTNHDVYAVYLYQYRAVYDILRELLPYLVHSKKRLKVIDFLAEHDRRFNPRGRQ